jgi:hypothetical protein
VVYTFLLGKLPDFLEVMDNALKSGQIPAPEDEVAGMYTTIRKRLEYLFRNRAAAPSALLIGAAETVYRLILDQKPLGELLGKTFGINEYVTPRVGEALTQVNDRTEKKARDADKTRDLWNFHWAGVIMTDGADYITLENIAVDDLRDVSEEDKLRNPDLFPEVKNPDAATPGHAATQPKSSK